MIGHPVAGLAVRLEQAFEGHVRGRGRHAPDDRRSERRQLDAVSPPHRVLLCARPPSSLWIRSGCRPEGRRADLFIRPGGTLFKLSRRSQSDRIRRGRPDRKSLSLEELQAAVSPSLLQPCRTGMTGNDGDKECPASRNRNNRQPWRARGGRALITIRPCSSRYACSTMSSATTAFCSTSSTATPDDRRPRHRRFRTRRPADRTG